MAYNRNANPYYRVGVSKTRSSLTNAIHIGAYTENNIPEKEFDYYEGRPIEEWYYSDYDD